MLESGDARRVSHNALKFGAKKKNKALDFTFKQSIVTKITQNLHFVLAIVINQGFYSSLINFSKES